MSFDFNYKLWVATRKDLEDLIKRQDILKKRRPINNPLITYKLFSEMYVLYVELVNKLGYLHLHTFQVQKRQVIRPIVEAATRRLIELKVMLKDLELSEYIYVDKAMIPRKLTPYDLVIWRSPDFLYRRPLDIQNIIYDNAILMRADEVKEKFEESLEQRTDALTLIQAHERGRRNRVYRSAIKYNRTFLKVRTRKIDYRYTHSPDQIMSMPIKRTIFKTDYIKSSEYCQQLMKTSAIDTTSADLVLLEKLRENAAIIIQTAWRRFKDIQMRNIKSVNSEYIYGMKQKRRVVKTNFQATSVIESYKNDVIRKLLDEDYIRLMTDERTRLLQERGPWILEDISDHIRAWFKEFYDKVGEFYPYPSIVQKGTVLVLIDETLSPLDFQEKLKDLNLSKEEKTKRAEKEKLKKQKEKEKKKKEKIKEAKRRKKMKAAGIYDVAYDLRNNKNLETILETMKQYSTDWKLIDEYLVKYDPIKEWVTETQLAIIHKELRALVDEYMRVEYEILRNALAADKKRKYIPTKNKNPKERAKKKKNTPQSMTANRTLKSLYHELQDAGIIEKYDKKSFHDFIGEYNFLADDLRDEHHFTNLGPTKSDVKMSIQECIMGMGEFSVNKPKSLCLMGPLNNGKKLLCRIIASEIDAVFMNLSPEKTNQFSKNMNYFLHVVMRVAKGFQPTILFINDVHRVFWKRIPKDQIDVNPWLLQPFLIKKILKPIKKDDKILLIGTTDAPWTTKAKFKKVFQKIILVPNTDYGTSFLIWLHLLSQNTEEEDIENYIISALAKVFQKYTTGDIAENVCNTMHIKRRIRLKRIPLDAVEFLDYFLHRAVPIFPLDDKITEKSNKWYGRVNKYSKIRNMLLEIWQKKAEKKRG